MILLIRTVGVFQPQAGVFRPLAQRGKAHLKLAAAVGRLMTGRHRHQCGGHGICGIGVAPRRVGVAGGGGAERLIQHRLRRILQVGIPKCRAAAENIVIRQVHIDGKAVKRFRFSPIGRRQKIGDRVGALERLKTAVLQHVCARFRILGGQVALKIQHVPQILLPTGGGAQFFQPCKKRVLARLITLIVFHGGGKEPQNRRGVWRQAVIPCGAHRVAEFADAGAIHQKRKIRKRQRAVSCIINFKVGARARPQKGFRDNQRRQLRQIEKRHGIACAFLPAGGEMVDQALAAQFFRRNLHREKREALIGHDAVLRQHPKSKNAFTDIGNQLQLGEKLFPILHQRKDGQRTPARGKHGRGMVKVQHFLLLSFGQAISDFSISFPLCIFKGKAKKREIPCRKKGAVKTSFGFNSP